MVFFLPHQPDVLFFCICNCAGIVTEIFSHRMHSSHWDSFDFFVSGCSIGIPEPFAELFGYCFDQCCYLFDEPLVVECEFRGVGLEVGQDLLLGSGG